MNPSNAATLPTSNWSQDPDPHGFVTLDGHHWFQNKAIVFCTHGRRPARLAEWIRCGWNADIFYGPVPFLKLVLVGSWLIAWLS